MWPIGCCLLTISHAGATRCTQYAVRLAGIAYHMFYVESSQAALSNLSCMRAVSDCSTYIANACGSISQSHDLTYMMHSTCLTKPNNSDNTILAAVCQQIRAKVPKLEHGHPHLIVLQYVLHTCTAAPLHQTCSA